MIWTVLLIVGVLLLLAFWINKCIVRPGMGDVPYWAVFLRFGRPVRAVLPGLYWKWWPIERVFLVYTGIYTMHFEVIDAHSMEKDGFTTQPLKLYLTLYLRWPKPDEKYTLAGAEKEGDTLLCNAFFYLPKTLRNQTRPHVDELGKFLEGDIVGGMRRIVAHKSHKEVREDMQALEDELKEYLLSEPGTPFFSLRLPGELIDVEITRVVFPEDTQQALRKPELSRKDAEALVEEAKGRKNASEDEKVAIENLLQGYISKGVSPEWAAVMVGKTKEGEKLSLGELRDLAITLAMIKKP